MISGAFFAFSHEKISWKNLSTIYDAVKLRQMTLVVCLSFYSMQIWMHANISEQTQYASFILSILDAFFFSISFPSDRIVNLASSNASGDFCFVYNFSWI